MGYNRPVRAAAALLALLIALVALAEVTTRILLDDAVTTAATAGLARASGDGPGFAEVSGDARGWAVPDLVRGRLTGVVVVAEQGELGGLPVRRLTASGRMVALNGDAAQDVVIDAAVDPAVFLPSAGQAIGADLSGGRLAPAGPDLLRYSGDVQGVPLTADLRLLPDGAGGLQATVEAVTAGDAPVAAALVPSTGLQILGPQNLPAGFAVESATVLDAGGTALVQVVLHCAGACDLSALGGLTGGAAATVPG